MRTLASALTSAQQGTSLDPAVKLVLTKGGSSTTYYYHRQESARRIKKVNHLEEPYRQNATIYLDNSDAALSDLDFKGAQAVLSYGVLLKTGALYSASAPLVVRDQQPEIAGGISVVSLYAEGVPDMMSEDRASETYSPHINVETGLYEPSGSDTYTIEDLLTAVIGATLGPFTHCKAYSIEWGTCDDLMTTYKPREGFRIYRDDSNRLAAVRRLLDFTKCVMRIKNDGTIYIFQPTTTGSSYDYEYSLDSGHPFLAKAFRRTLVIPNYILVRSREDDDEPHYEGVATDNDSINALSQGFGSGKGEVQKSISTKLDSNQQASDIAEAVLGKYQLNAEMGSAECLMNCGAELFDYVKVGAFGDTDTYRTGNLGSIRRKFDFSKSNYEAYYLTFSFGGWLTVRGLASNLTTYEDGISTRDESYFVSYFSAEMADIDFLSVLTAHMGLLTAGEIRIGQGVLLPSGTATSGGNDSLTDTDKSWTVNEWAGENVRIVIDGTAYTRGVKSNDSDTLVFFALPEGVEVSAGDSYYLGHLEVSSGTQYYLRGSGSGTATGGSTSTLIDTSQNWETNAYEGKRLVIIIDGVWIHRTVSSNSSNTLTFGTLPEYVPFTGFRLWAEDLEFDIPDEGYLGRIAGYKEGVMQFYSGSDGVLYAGGGSIKLDADGVHVYSEFDAPTNKIFFYEDEVLKASIQAWALLGLYVKAESGVDITLFTEGGGAVNIPGKLIIPHEAA